MEPAWKSILWGQFGAAIDMLENAMNACPEALWSDRARQPEFWYLVYHTLFWLDYYLSEDPAGFAPPAPFNLDEMDPAGLLPDRVYTKAKLRAYLEHGRGKCRVVIAGMSEAQANERRGLGSSNQGTFEELLLYNLRHVQHHAAQLNLLLRQNANSAPRWVARAKDELPGQ